MSRSPIYKKDESSRGHLKGHASVPKRFPTTLLEQKTKQPIESIQKVMNFVNQKKYAKPQAQVSSIHNKSSHQLLGGAPFDPYSDNSQIKNVTFARQIDFNQNTRDKSPSYAGKLVHHQHNYSQAEPRQVEPRHTDVAASAGNFRPFFLLQGNTGQNTHHERKVSDVPKSIARASPAKATRHQSTSSANIFLVPNNQRDRYTRVKHNSYASIYANSQLADHSARDISPSLVKNARKDMPSHSKSKSSITPTKNDNPSPEFNFESPLPSNRGPEDPKERRFGSGSRSNNISPAPLSHAEKLVRVDRRLKYTPTSLSQPQSTWEFQRGGAGGSDFLDASKDSFLNRSALEEGNRRNTSSHINDQLNGSSKNPQIKSLNLQKLHSFADQSGTAESNNNHSRSFSSILNPQYYPIKENISADRYLYELQLQQQQPQSQSQQLPHHSRSHQVSLSSHDSTTYENPKVTPSAYQQIIDEHRQLLTGVGSSNLNPNPNISKSSSSRHSRTPAKDQPPQNIPLPTFQNYISMQKNSGRAPVPAKTRGDHSPNQHSLVQHSSNSYLAPSHHQSHHVSNSSSISYTYINNNQSFNYGTDANEPDGSEYYDSRDNLDENPAAKKLKKLTLHNYRSYEQKVKEAHDHEALKPMPKTLLNNKTPLRQSSPLIDAKLDDKSRLNRRTHVHQSMGQVPNNLLQDPRAAYSKSTLRNQASSSNVNTRSTELLPKNPASQSKTLHGQSVRESFNDNSLLQNSRPKSTQRSTKNNSSITSHSSLVSSYSSKNLIHKRSVDEPRSFDEVFAAERVKAQYSNPLCKPEFTAETFSRLDMQDFPLQSNSHNYQDFSEEKDRVVHQTPRIPSAEVGESYHYKNPLELSSLQNETISQFEGAAALGDDRGDDFSMNLSKNFTIFSPDMMTSTKKGTAEKAGLEYSSARRNPIGQTPTAELEMVDESFAFDEMEPVTQNNNGYSKEARVLQFKDGVKGHSTERETSAKVVDAPWQGLASSSSALESSRNKSMSKTSYETPNRVRRSIDGSLTQNSELWKPSKLPFVTNFKGHCNTVTCLARDTSKNTIFSGSLDGSILNWNVNDLLANPEAPYSNASSGKEVRIPLKGVMAYKKPVNALIYHPFTRKIISGSSDKTIKIWHNQSYECESTLKGHTGGVFALLSLDAHQLASGSGDQRVNIWDIERGALLTSLQDHSNRVTSLCRVSSRDNNLFISGSTDSKIKMWDLRVSHSIAGFDNHESSVSTVINIEDNLIASAGLDGQLIVWDMLHRRVKDQYNLESEIHSIAYYKPAEKIIAGTEQLNIVDLYGEKKVEVIEDSNGHTGSIKSLLIDYTLDVLYTGSFDRDLKVWLLKRNSSA